MSNDLFAVLRSAPQGNRRAAFSSVVLAIVLLSRRDTNGVGQIPVAPRENPTHSLPLWGSLLHRLTDSILPFSGQL